MLLFFTFTEGTIVQDLNERGLYEPGIHLKYCSKLYLFIVTFWLPKWKIKINGSNCAIKTTQDVQNPPKIWISMENLKAYNTQTPE